MADFASPLTNFEAWHSTRKNSKQKIPDNLWAMACELSALHGSAQVAKLLRLNHGELKRRANGVAGNKKEAPSSLPTSVRVMPLVIHDGKATVPQDREPPLVAELVCSQGVRLRLYAGVSSELVKALLSLALEVK